MQDFDPLPLKNQLAQKVESMEDWQVRLVLSFVSTLFGSDPAPVTD